jgi:beta-N-acetylhexosaminidase
MPGHGRSMCDSHIELPVVTASEEELERDIEPFRTLRWAPMGMTAHVVYTAWDAEHCGSLSARVIGEIIRDRIGFDGFLMSDDLCMHALSGDFGARASGVVEAGCDVGLHCSGIMEEMIAVANALGEMREESKARLDRAMATVAGAQPTATYAELTAKRDALLAYA